MSGFLKALAKAGLIRLSDEQQRATDQTAGITGDDALQAILDDDAFSDFGNHSNDAFEREPAATGNTDIRENRPFEEIYTQTGIKPCPYPAEKLLRVLDGLKAMDLATRKAAVMAIDTADDEWTIEDPVLDAQRKIQALDKHKASLVKIVASAEKTAAQNLATQTEYQNQATLAIREEIAALEQRLESELACVANEKAAIQTHLQGARDASIRELTRLDKEIIRLRELSTIFVPAAKNHDNNKTEH